MKNKIKYILSTIMYLFLVSVTEINAVGFHSSGSSSSSSSSSSSGGNLFGLIILSIIYIILTKIGKQKAREKQERLKNQTALFLSEDINFCDELLESQIQNNILDVLYAINDNNINELYIYCTDNFIQNHREIISNLNLNVDHIAWLTTEIQNINSDNIYDYIELSLKFDIINGTSTTTKYHTVILKRADKVITKGLNQSRTLNACKCCGAPMDYKKTYTCEYCGNQSKLSEQDTWLIDNIR